MWQADALHTLLMKRADALEAYELKRWPDGKVAGGKG